MENIISELSKKHIDICKDMTYGVNGRNAGNEDEGDYGTWRDWQARLILFGRDLINSSKKEPTGCLFNNRFYKTLEELRGFTMSEDNKPIPLYK